MNELRPDLTIGEIKAWFKNDVELKLFDDNSYGFYDDGMELSHPNGWINPKVKKWIPKKAKELEVGDTMVLNGVSVNIHGLCGNLNKKVSIFLTVFDDSISRHMDEFVTVEVEE